MTRPAADHGQPWPQEAAAARATTAVDEAVATGRPPGAVLLAGDRTGTHLDHTAGLAERAGIGRATEDLLLTGDTWFDLASLTKVLVTLPCILLLVADGRLDLDEPVQLRLPAFTGAGKDAVTVRQLLTHTSGLPPHRELWLRAHDRDGVLLAALAEPLQAAPGTTVAYSDLGFLTLGALVEQLSGRRLDDVWAERVAAPLGLQHSGFRPDKGVRTAATEPPPAGPDRPGIVHDQNARAAGGVAGHAGLFGAAGDVATYVRSAWLSDALLPADLRAEAVTLQTPGLGGCRGLGWVLRGDPYDHAGAHWPDSGAGHTGFTGTSVELDPPSGHWVVLLTNAVHAGRDRPGIRALRDRVHDTLADPSDQS